MTDLSKTLLTQREQTIMEAILEATAGELKRQNQRITELEQKLAALQQRKAFAYTGIWTADDQYYEGDFATFQGSLWCCTVSSTQARQGTSDDWQLAVKRGRAA